MGHRQRLGGAGSLTESGSSTELCLVYPALSAMPVVGPVTRGQDLYWRLLSGQQVLPIQCGSSAYAKRYLEYYNLRAVDAQEVGRNAFVSTGYGWNSTPLWRTSGKAVASVLDSLSISAAVNQSASGSESETAGVLPALLPQRDTGHLPDANAADAVKVTVISNLAVPPALSMMTPLPPTGCNTLTAPPSWTPTPAHRRSLTTCSSCTAALLRTDATRWTTTFHGRRRLAERRALWQVTWTQGVESTLALYDSNGKPLELPAAQLHRPAFQPYRAGAAGAKQLRRSAGGRPVNLRQRDDFKCAPRCFAHIQRKIYYYNLRLRNVCGRF